MMMQEYQAWLKSDNKSELGDEDSPDNFSIFYQHNRVGKGFMEMLSDLAYQVYELQVIVEGLLEDLEQ